MSYSSEYIGIPPEDDKVKVSGVSIARALRFLGTGVSVADNPTNKTIDVTVGGTSGRGISIQSGDGSTKVFTINHGSTTTPLIAFVQAQSPDASGSIVVTVDATNITVTYPFAPPIGNLNLSLEWMVVT
jgi:hypothetical protein